MCHLWRDVCYRLSVWKGEVATVRLSHTSKKVLHSIRSRGIKKFKVREHKSNLERITRTFDSITSLDLSGCYYTTDEAIERAFSNTRVFSELESFTLNYCYNVTEQGLCVALSKMPRLKILSLKGCKGIRLCLQNVKDCMRASCNNLEYLSVAGCKQLGAEDLAGVLDGVTNLRELDLEDCDHIHDECFQCVRTAGLLQLRTLNLSFCVSISDQGLLAIAKSLPNLTKLRVRSVDNVTSCGISAILQGCPRLKTLDLALCDWLKDDSIEDIVRKVVGNHHHPSVSESRVKNPKRFCGDGALNSLEELDLSCAKISDNGMKLISEHMPRLKHLKIGQCLELTDTSLQHIGANLLNLTTIDAYGCNFSVAAIDVIRCNLPHLNRVNLFMFL